MNSENTGNKNTYIVQTKKPKKCALSDGKPCVACERQSKLRREIEVTEEILDMLIVKERQAQAEIKRYHDSGILTVEERSAQQKMNPYHDPFHQFPPEVTSHIFCLTLPDFETGFDSFFSRRGTEFALTLGAVCKAWRMIAWSTPRLWTKMMLTLRGAPTRNQIAVAEEWIERSRQLKLTIRLSFMDCDSNPEEEDRSMFQMFVDVLNEHSHRWETLSLDLPACLSQLFTGNEIGAPLLKTLQLSIGRSEGYEVGRFSLKGRMPQPNYVSIKTIGELDDIEICWDNVTTGTVKDVALQDCLRLLHWAPTLVDLHLQKILYEVSYPPITEIPLVLHDLRTLDFSPDTLWLSTSPTVYSPIFDQVTLPFLESFAIHSPDNTYIPLPSNSLKVFLDRSSPPLTTFHLGRIKCDQQEALVILYALPISVKNIKLDITLPRGRKDLDLGDLFDHLSRTPTARNRIPSRSELLPNLETFEYQVFRATRIPWGRLPNLLRPVSGKQRPFKKLTIIDRDGIIKYSRSFLGKPPSLLAKRLELDESIIRDLIKFKEDGVNLFLPHRVSSQELLALLEE